MLIFKLICILVPVCLSLSTLTLQDRQNYRKELSNVPL